MTDDSDRRRLGLPNGLSAFPLAVLIVAAAIIIGVSLYENVVAGLVEGGILLIGVWGSYVLGQQSVPGGDARPHARKAYRRMATLHGQQHDRARR